MVETDHVETDIFDGLLDLEDGYYQEGYKLGEVDGETAGHLQGRAFGIEKGFEKFLEMGRLNGRATVWSGRLSGEGMKSGTASGSMDALREDETSSCRLRPLPSVKLESHLRTLYALTEPDSLSTENNEANVADFDDRLRRALGKVKIIERLADDRSLSALSTGITASNVSKPKSQLDGNIEDVSILHARH